MVVALWYAAKLPAAGHLMQLDQLKRREFIALLGGAAAWPLAARAQQGAIPLIGFLHGGSPGPFAFHAAAFRNGLSEEGFVEGHNVSIAYRWAEQRYDRLPALVANLIEQRVALIATGGGSSQTIAAMAATKTIPIVFTTGADPVQLGLVKSLNRPDANVTGVTFFGSGAIGGKQVEFLHSLLPNASTMAVLIRKANPNTKEYLTDLRAAADALKVDLDILNVESENDLKTAFDKLSKQQIHGVIIGGDPILSGNRALIVALAARYAIPTIYLQRQFADAGGLMSYGTSQTDAYRMIGVYAGRVLKGARPADMPVLRPTKFELVINLKTAKTLGVQVPLSLEVAADEVIE
jgi:putative tryptophan/tyrosine transport system substrate-binding protein